MGNRCARSQSMSGEQSDCSPGPAADGFPTPRGQKRAAAVSAPTHDNAHRLVQSPETTPKPEGWTRFVCFSDTHGLHDQIAKEHCPEGDVLLHAGDFTNTGELE